VSTQKIEPNSYHVIFDEVSIGSTTLHFISREETVEAQLGYSIGSNGEDLTGDEDGDWKKSWEVIGYEDLCGDPIFVDHSSEGSPVFTAMHGMGEWRSTAISDSFDAFNKSLRIVAEIAVGRENPVKLEANPISLAEIEGALETIRALNPNSEIEFWELLLGI